MAARFAKQLFHHSYYLVYSHFLPLWLFLLVVIVACGLFLGNDCRQPASRDLPRQGFSGWPRFPRILSLTDTIWGTVLLLFVACYVMVIFHKEDFCYYDEDMLTETTLQGKNFPFPIWPGLGRFFPLGEQEFNLLRYFTKSPEGYHAFAVVQLLVLLLALYFVLREFKLAYRVPILIAAMLTPSSLIPFTGLIYPERNVLFWLGIMLFCLYRHSKTKGRVYFVGCLVAAHFALYYKELVVFILVPFAVTRILLQLRIDPRGIHRPWRELARENSVPLGILAVSGLYVAQWVVIMLPHRGTSYVDTLRASPGSALLGYLHTNWLPFVLVAVLILRLGGLVIRKDELDPLWDSLAVGALACFFCLVGLGLYAAYYAAPVDLIALVYIAEVSRSWLSRPTRLRLTAVAIGFLCLVLHDAAYSSFRLIERKGIISLRSQFADFLRGYRPTAGGGTIKLFFPYASGKRLMELSVYLNYRGIPLVGQTGRSMGTGPAVVFEGRQEYPRGRCIDYRDYACVHTDSPQDGALIVVLPDDHAPTQDVVQNAGNDSALLFESEACGFCTRGQSWFKYLHTISAGFWNAPLPDHWLQLHVFKRTSPAFASGS